MSLAMRFFSGLALTVLVGCGGLFDDTGSDDAPPVPSQITLSNGLAINAPSEYCARPKLTKAQSGLVFVAFSPCQNTDKTFLTIALRRMPALSLAKLPDPQTSSDQLITRVSDGAMKLAQLRNSDLQLMQSVDQTFWRMVSYDNDYLVLANLYSAPGKTVSQKTAQRVFDGVSWTVSISAQSVSYLPMTQPWPKPKYRP